MRNSTKRLLSFALAGTIITGVAPMKAGAETNTEEVVQEEVVEEKQPITYTVKKGDTLGNICKKFFGSDVHYPYLAAFNNIEDPSLIYPGQVLYIPASLAELMTVESPKECEEDKTYTVQTGDTLYCIVRVQYGLTNQEAVDKLATYNGLSDPNRISKGQVLKIPCKEKLLEVNVEKRFDCSQFLQSDIVKKKMNELKNIEEYQDLTDNSLLLNTIISSLLSGNVFLYRRLTMTTLPSFIYGAILKPCCNENVKNT